MLEDESKNHIIGVCIIFNLCQVKERMGRGRGGELSGNKDILLAIIS